MTEYQQAFLELMQQRDTMYLGIFILVVVGFLWYKLWLKPLFKLVLAVAGLLVGLALAWGLWQLFPDFINITLK